MKIFALVVEKSQLFWEGLARATNLKKYIHFPGSLWAEAKGLVSQTLKLQNYLISQ